MSGLSTHVLDTSTGLPAPGILVEHFEADVNASALIAGGVTDSDGRVNDLLHGALLQIGNHRLVFQTGNYFDQLGVNAFFPIVTIDFTVSDSTRHHHVPLLLAPFSYSTYRGS
jgi:5-hydroxyisourate hydrolase